MISSLFFKLLLEVLVFYLRRLPNQGHRDLFLCFLLKLYNFSSYVIVCDPFWVIIVYDLKKEYYFTHLYVNIWLFPIWKEGFSPLNCLYTLVENNHKHKVLFFNYPLYYINMYVCSPRSYHISITVAL